jgi:hypothetical protein
MALLYIYLVKKPQLLRQIVRWLLLFLEYDFLVVYKPKHSYSMSDALSQLLDATKNSRVPIKTIDALLFLLQP